MTARYMRKPELLDAPTADDDGASPAVLPNAVELLDRVRWLRRKPWLNDYDTPEFEA